MTDAAAAAAADVRLRRSRMVEIAAWLVPPNQDLPDALRRFCANPMPIPVQIRPVRED